MLGDASIDTRHITATHEEELELSFTGNISKLKKLLKGCENLLLGYILQGRLKKMRRL